MNSIKQRRKIRKFRLTAQQAKVSKKVDELAKKMDGFKPDTQNSAVYQLETTIQKLERQLEKERREREAVFKRVVKKEFVLTHDFYDCITMREGEEFYGDPEEHFGAKWSISIQREEDAFGVFLQCEAEDGDKDWSIEVEETLLFTLEGRIVKMERGDSIFFENDGTSMGYDDFLEWEEFEKEMSRENIDCPVTIEYRVTILKAKGLRNQRPEKYTSPVPNLTDVVLNVEDRKFHVSRQCLANHCDFFHHLFYENFAEKGKPEVTLHDIDPFDFQNFLDVVYGEQLVDEPNIEGILVIADMYRADKTIAICEKFLIYESTKELKTKYDLSIQYKMAKLTKACISKISTMKDYEEIVTDSLDDVEGWVSKELVRKSIELSKSANKNSVKKLDSSFNLTA